MKKNVLEKQFKEKIDAREIAPSKASWDRLDAMLTVTEKPKRNFRWMYVAACFLGFLLLGTLYFNQNKVDAVIAKDTIVVNESKEVPELKVAPEENNSVKSVEVSKIAVSESVVSETKAKVDSNIVLSNKESQVVEKEVIQAEQVSIINQKTEQSIVPQKSKYVNADELLASVDNASSLKTNSLPVKSNVKVNSNQLLTQVDGELDLSFREKAIKTVNQNFKAVKLALSNRNSE